MPHYSEKTFLPYARNELFDLVADVAKYPEYLPWCVGARILKRREEGFDADLIIGFSMFRETFTSRVVLNPHTRIDVSYIKGPLKHLHNQWVFHDTNGGTMVEFEVDFAFKSSILEKMIGHLFEEATHKMVQAFEKRAGEKLVKISA